MTHEPLEQDVALGQALRALDADAAATPDWDRLHHGITTHAAQELARRRAQHRRRAMVLAAGLAAGLLLFLATWQAPPAVLEQASVPGETAVTTRVSTDELLDAEVSDAEFRALLFGATDADALLMIAAEEQ